MSATWTINGTPLATLGLEFTGGTFNAGSRSVMTLRKTGDFTAADLFPWGTPVTLRRNGVAFFQGKVRSLPHSASDSEESQQIQITDAWQDLEETIYKEKWLAGSDSVMLPIAILGRKSNGAPCTDAQQIQEAVAYAVSAGVAIQMGSIPAGLPLWQSEVRNVAVAEVIRLSLRFHPDWVPWIDHATTPPTLNFTPRAGMTTRIIDIGDGDTTSVSITRRDDLKPDAVQILYLNATIIDGTTYRDWIEDRFPPGGPSAGPRVISNVVELAGGQMQFQKQRIKTRELPKDHDELKEWLKKKFPELKEVPEGHWSARMLSKKLMPKSGDEANPDPEPEPINPRAQPLHAETAADVPRELVKGSIEDWMRRKVGRVKIEFALKIAPAASAASREKLERIAAMKSLTPTATNAITKVYKGITQWVDAEDAPVGVAAAIYNSLSAYQYEGSITTVMEDVSGDRFHGCRLNVAGGRAEWAGMNAMVHSMSFDIATGSTTISVGPAPFLAAADMLGLQRLLRGRKVTWMSEAERSSKELGAESAPGSKGDSVGGYDRPEEETAYKKGLVHRFEPYIGGDDMDRLYVSPGAVVYVPVAQEARDDDDNRAQGKQIEPVIPTIEDKPLDDAEDTPYFEIGLRTSAAVWLCAQRLKCATALATDESTERLEMLDRGQKPEEVEGEVHVLLFELDLESEDGRKRIAKLDQRVGSDVTVPFICEEIEVSEEDTSEFDSDDLQSSDLEDVPDSDSDSDEAECPWSTDSRWYRPQSCYYKNPKRGSVTIGVLTMIDLGRMFRRCRNWVAYISAENGQPRSDLLDAGQEAIGNEIKVKLTKRETLNIRSRFYFTTTPCKTPQKVKVRLFSEQKEGVTEEDKDECCGSAAKSYTIDIGSWPGWCEYNGHCGSTTVLPP